LNDLAEQVLKFVTVYREQHGDLVARCFRLENLANSEMEARDRISRHADRLEQRLEKIERFIDGSSMGCAEMSQRIEKMEKALSEEMAKTREMDDILAGVVKRVGHPSEAMEDDFKAELLKWLDIEIAMAEENLEQANRAHMVVATAKMQAMLATYKAVKAHIQG